MTAMNDTPETANQEGEIENCLNGVRELLSQGAGGDAEDAARRHLQTFPGSFRLSKALAVTLMLQGKFAECLDLLQELHAERPGDADVTINLAKAHLELKDHQSAEQVLAGAEGLDAAALLSRCLIEGKELDRADAVLDKALAEFGAHPQLLVDRSAIAIHRADAAAFGYLDQAEQGLAQMPEAMRAAFRQMIRKNRALAALELDRLDQARSFASGLGPDDAEYLLARIDCGGRKYEAAIQRQLNVYGRQPTGAQALFLAQLYLASGDYSAAWPYWERRDAKPAAAVGIAEWKGEPLAGKRILAAVEQGTGDVMQFGRYLSLLADRGAEIQCPMFDELQLLFETSFPDICFDSVDPGGPGFDFQVPLLSVPAILNLDAEAAILTRSPYLMVAPEATNKWKQTLPTGTNIGVCWKGNPENYNDRRRSIHQLDPLKNLIETTPANFVSLQWPATDMDQFAGLRDEGRFYDYAHLRQNFGDTAALVSALDGVLTVDTSIAHLAGAIGETAAVVNPFDPDWRWSGLGPDWYGDWIASFRQPAPGDWPSVLNDAHAWLAQRLNC
jgi:hypothetical protein